MPFAPSIAILSIFQASLIALPRATSIPLARRFANRWWALVLPGSIVLVVSGIALDPGLADGLTYLALVAVPILAAVALSRCVRGARPALAVAVVPLFAIAWGPADSLAAEAAAVALSGLACVALGCLICSVVPQRWVALAIYAMAIVDACLVGADLLQAPNDVLNAAAPAAHLPQLQLAHFGSAVIGFGDLFVAGVLGAMLADRPALQIRGAALAAVLALAFDLLFFLVSELPATVPVAVALAVLQIRGRRSSQAPAVAAPGPTRARDPRAAAA